MPFCRASVVAVAVLLATAIAWPAIAASLDGLAVEVTGRSEPVLCAEKDNVSIALASKDVRSFRIEAGHPTYIAALQRDSFEADWTACDMAADPAHAGEVKAPTRRTIYEEPDLWLVGWTFPTFWRPATATVRIGERVEKGLHLVQVWRIRPMGGEEVLVVYPQDGYWRARPLAPEGRAPTAFGTSFLVGPVEQEGRPLVKLKEIAFDPPARTFALAFERGGSATLTMVQTDRNRHAIDVRFDKGIEGRPFAMLRSMYVTDFNNDASRIALREKGARAWRELPVMRFVKGNATDLWLGRTAPSQHNTSSPDMVVNSFSDTADPKRPKAEPPPELRPKARK